MFDKIRSVSKNLSITLGNTSRLDSKLTFSKNHFFANDRHQGRHDHDLSMAKKHDFEPFQLMKREFIPILPWTWSQMLDTVSIILTKMMKIWAICSLALNLRSLKVRSKTQYLFKKCLLLEKKYAFFVKIRIF